MSDLCLRFGPYFVEPVIAGLEKGTNKPFIATTDLIGCLTLPKDFAVAGTASDKLFGVAEGLWEPDLVRPLYWFGVWPLTPGSSGITQEPEDLFETISQTLMNAVDRDAYSGWGAIVHVM